MYVQELLKQKGTAVITTDPDETIQATALLLHTHRIGAVIVCDPVGAVVGVISERDIVRGMAFHADRVHSMKVRDLMSVNVHTCTPEDTMQQLMEAMTNQRIRHLPVIEEGRLRGIVSIGDVVKERLGECTFETESLRDYVMTSR